MSLAAKMFHGEHDCGPIALCKVFPHLKYGKVREAFLYSTKLWPSGPVSNKDMNIALRYLNIYERFEYQAHLIGKKKKIIHFTKQQDTTFILLFKWHYTVVSNCKILEDTEFFFRNKPVGSIRVFNSWKLL